MTQGWMRGVSVKAGRQPSRRQAQQGGGGGGQRRCICRRPRESPTLAPHAGPPPRPQAPALLAAVAADAVKLQALGEGLAVVRQLAQHPVGIHPRRTIFPRPPAALLQARLAATAAAALPAAAAAAAATDEYEEKEQAKEALRWLGKAAGEGEAIERNERSGAAKGGPQAAVDHGAPCAAILSRNNTCCTLGSRRGGQRSPARTHRAYCERQAPLPSPPRLAFDHRHRKPGLRSASAALAHRLQVPAQHQPQGPWEGVLGLRKDQWCATNR